MKQGFYYLAVPFQGSKEEEHYRTQFSLKAATSALRQGVYLFAPVNYVNTIAQEFGFTSSDKRREIVMPYLLEFLRVSKGLVLVTLEGWQKSWGVQQELKFCLENGISVYKADPSQVDKSLNEALLSPLGQLEIEELIGRG